MVFPNKKEYGKVNLDAIRAQQLRELEISEQSCFSYQPRCIRAGQVDYSTYCVRALKCLIIASPAKYARLHICVCVHHRMCMCVFAREKERIGKRTSACSAISVCGGCACVCVFARYTTALLCLPYACAHTELAQDHVCQWPASQTTITRLQWLSLIKLFTECFVVVE